MKKDHLLNYKLVAALAISSACIGLAACGEKSSTQHNTIKPENNISGKQIDSNSTLQHVSQLIPLRDNSISISERSGIKLLNQSGETISQVKGKFELADYRIIEGQLRLLANNKNTNTPSLFSVEDNSITLVNEFISPEFNIDGLCLHYDSQHLFAFYLDGEGRAQQWLLADQGDAKAIRSFATAPGSFCTVDDSTETLYVSEETTGVWSYEASPEAQSGRKLDTLSSDWGGFIGSSIGAVTAIPTGYAVISIDEHLVSLVQSGKLVDQFILASSADTEQLSLTYDDDKISFNAIDDSGRLFQWTHSLALPRVVLQADITEIKATAQTQAMPRLGDVADDPAIWFNQTNAERSLIFGTNKTAGLHSYNLQGQQKQFLATGRLNNVDVAYQTKLADKTIDIAGASLRDDNSIAMFTISAAGLLTEAGQIATTMESIYGLCMFQSQGKTYVLANDKSGLFQQYEIGGNSNRMTGTLDREFSLPGQPEGCAVDEMQQRLFMGEEDAGIWTLDVSPNSQSEPTLIHKIGDYLTDDVEGMSIYQGKKQGYLVVSSQGNNSYAVFNSQAPFAFQGSFRIDMNVDLGIDGVSETDGLHVSSKNFGGIYSQGMLVVQDGHNVFPSEAQNFKILPWSAIASALSLD